MTNFLFTSESVTEGHPDKICDAVSDAILDAILEQDPNARVACETLVKTGIVFVAGEIRTKAYVHFPDVVRKTVKDIGYTNSDLGFDANTCSVVSAIERQSSDIALGVDGNGSYEHGEMGAGDQGMMFGFASSETPELMPMPIFLAHKLARRLADVRKQNIVPFLRPDGKTQVTIRYVDNKPKFVDTIVVSSQHNDGVSHKQIEESIMETVVKPVIPHNMLVSDTKFFVNPTGKFVIGGPLADAGLTGRKIIVDTYGGMANHGGGAFSGKDPSKVDRSAAYMARFIAKNIVAAGLAKKCEIQLSYAIGMVHPISVMVRTFGTSKLSEEEITNIVKEVFDCRPSSIIKELDLLKPRYLPTSSYGHFGRTEDSFTWEKLTKVEQLKSFL